jgi:hypothetical protein
MIRGLFGAGGGILQRRAGTASLPAARYRSLAPGASRRPDAGRLRTDTPERLL